MWETWYVLENDEAADPRDVAPDEKGILRHKSGVAVAIGPHGPRSRGVDVRKAIEPEAPKRGYKTREAKAR